MAVDDHRRGRLFERLADVLGVEEATTMAELLPPSGTEGATRHDIARLDARLDGMDVHLAGIDTRLGEMDVRLGGIDTRLGEMDARFDAIDTRFDHLDLRLDDRFGLLRGELLAAFRGELVTAVAGQTRTVVVAMISTAVTVVGGAFALAQVA